MKPGIYLSHKELVFNEYPKHEIGFARYCKSFRINLENIAFIALSPRLIIDDESIFILLISKKGKRFVIPQNALHEPPIKALEDHFQLKPFRDEWNEIDYENHYGSKDKILYPTEFYGKNLYKIDWKLALRSLYSWIIPKSFFGNYTNNVNLKLKNLP